VGESLKLQCEAASRQTDPWTCRRLIYDPREWQIDEDEAISRMKTDELDRLVAAGTIKEIHRERVRLTVHRIVYPPERPNDMCLSQTTSFVA
jgi:hypothetical protein